MTPSCCSLCGTGWVGGWCCYLQPCCGAKSRRTIALYSGLYKCPCMSKCEKRQSNTSLTIICVVKPRAGFGKPVYCLGTPQLQEQTWVLMLKKTMWTVKRGIHSSSMCVFVDCFWSAIGLENCNHTSMAHASAYLCARICSPANR